MQSHLQNAIKTGAKVIVTAAKNAHNLKH